MLLNLSLLALVLPLAVLADHGVPPQARHHARHHEIAQRAEGTVELHKRFSGARWSWYDTQTGNAGSCGKMISNSDMAVAMNVPQYSAGNCFKPVTLTWGGVTVTAIIMDMCPGCPYGGLDLSPGLFQRFAGLGKGIISDGSWTFGGGAAPPPPPPPPAPKPTPTPPPPPPPVTTKKTTAKPTPTTTYTPPTSSSSSTRSSSSRVSSSSSSSSARASSTSSSGNARATGVAGSSAGNLGAVNSLVVQFGEIVIAGANTGSDSSA